MDELDLQILEILDQNSRTPYDEIGKQVGLTGNAIRTRVVRLIEDEVIDDFAFKVNPEVFGIQTCYVKFQCPRKIKAAELIDQQLGKDSRYPEILTGIDGTTIVHVYGVGEEGLNQAINDLKRKISKAEVDLVIYRYKPPVEEVRINNSLLRVINTLTDDVRISVADLAKQCNMTSKSVKYYLKQIRKKKIGRFSVNLQPNKISERIFVSIFVSKPETDYIRFAALFDSVKQDIKNLIVKDYLLVDPPGIFMNLTTESLSEIDKIEKKITSFLEKDYQFWKMFPSRHIYRDNLVFNIIRERISNLERASVDLE